MRFIAAIVVITTVAFATSRFSGEKGVRAHRIRLAAGTFHACALLDDGTVECWGGNFAGQLGDGTQTNRTSPVAVANIFQAVSITAAASHSCAILVTSGIVRCWGSNSHGELGNGTTTFSTTPVAVSGLTNVVSVAAGGEHTCAVRVDGTAWCWGDNSVGQLGTGGFGGTSLAPVQVTRLSGAVAIVAGGISTCALLQNGTVQCWGQNQDGQLGDNSFTAASAPVFTAPLSPDPSAGAVELTAGGRSTCARLSTGSVSCWGRNSSGQLGDGTVTSSKVPVLVDVDPSVAAVATGGLHTCAILANGTVSCWGGDGAGPLGDGGAVNRLVPGPPVPGIANALEIATGADFTCVLVSGGTVRCFGDNQFGEHGNGTGGSAGTDSVIGINGTFLGRGVAAGNLFTCGRRGTGEAACWGAGAAGQLGNGAKTTSLNPVAVTGLSNTAGLSAGNGSHACAVDAQGQALCWGLNSHGQLGNGTTIDAGQPVKVTSTDPFVAISAGEFHTCALTAGGLVRCWGANDTGQLGNTGTVDSHVPVTVVLVSNAIAISAGRKFTCALIVDSTVRCWGDNSTRQLGDGGTETFSATAHAVGGLSNVAAIGTGANHACAVTVSGGALCWGANTRGQIGNNLASSTPTSFPTTVQGLTDAMAISGGAFFTCALRAGGGISCWGANDSGELSASDTADHLTPTPAGAFRICLFCPGGGIAFFPILTATAVVTGTHTSTPTEEHACALNAGGEIACWGDNTEGEIGDGATTNATRPTAVNSFAANVDPAATLRNSRIAEVTALINCESGENAHIVLALDQGAASGTGHADARCEDRLVRLPMTIPAQGPAGFNPGAATASVEAIGTHWTRQVVLSISK